MARFINPNLHVILIHYPLGLFMAGLVIELFSFLWRNSSVRTAGRWMILLGTLSIVPTATSGIYALQDAVAHGHETESWLQAKQESGLTPDQWQFIRDHVILNSIGAAVALVAVVTYIASSDFWRRRLYVPGILVLVLAAAFMIAGAWHGGEMVYRFGIAVNGREDVVRESGKPNNQLSRDEEIEKYLMPLQMHVAMAGTVLAAAAAAIGMALRGASKADDVLVQRMDAEDAGAAISSDTLPTENDPRPLVAVPSPDEPNTVHVATAVPPRVPSTRWWVVSALLALLTLLGGMYVSHYLQIGDGKPLFNQDHFNQEIVHATIGGHHEPLVQNQRRMQAHFILGSSILVLALVFALITRVAPRSRAMIAVFTLLVVLVSAAQVRMGILLLYDGDHGPLTRFRTADDLAAEEKSSAPTLPAMPTTPAPPTMPTMPLPTTTTTTPVVGTR